MATKYETTCDGCGLVTQGKSEDPKVRDANWSIVCHNLWLDNDEKQEQYFSFDLCASCALDVAKAVRAKVADINGPKAA